MSQSPWQIEREAEERGERRKERVELTVLAF